ncbi:MAG: SpaA isopeptide-forming pilin-related protein [Lachnospiraceae bacterium]|nr:SpaA isopeptide-forming pilin-related protein [Lachnospiraceae bacterium]
MKLGNYQKNFATGQLVSLAMSYKTGIDLTGFETWTESDIKNKASVTYKGYFLTDTKESNEVSVHTGYLTVTKYDSDTKATLKDVKFELYTKVGDEYFPIRREDDNTYRQNVVEKGIDGYDQVSESKTYEVTTGSVGQALFVGLHDGTYYLKETKAAAGYQLSADYIPVVVRDGSGSISVYDSKVVILSAGGKGSNYVPIIIVGLVILAAAGGFYFKQKKRK